MTDKNSCSHHHHHRCCPKQLQRQQGSQQPTTPAGGASATSCTETTVKKNEHHQNVITSVSSNQNLSKSSIDADNNIPITEQQTGAHKKSGHAIQNRGTPSSIVAANQHLNNLLNTPTNLISVTVAPFTGGPFTITVNKRDSVEELKKAVAKKLKVLKDRICLLYREGQLSEGSLEDNSVVDGSRITLLPRAETGLLAQKPEQSVMQALESLNDSQVVDFLSGKAPLNLTMRLGDHMMLIQLQLSTVNAASGNKRSRQPTPASAKTTANSSTPSTSHVSSSSGTANLPPCCSNKLPVSSPLTQSSSSSSRSHVSSKTQNSASSTRMSVNPPIMANTATSTPTFSSSTATSNPFRAPNSCPSPPTNSKHSSTTTHFKSNPSALSGSSSAKKHMTSSCPVQGHFNGNNTKSNYKPKLDTRALAEASKNLTQTLKQLSSEVLTTKSEEERPRKRARTNGSNLNGGSGEKSNNGGRNSGDRSENGQQGPSPASSGSSSRLGGNSSTGNGGAIIESMHHHGKGVYSGTFSGTLNPALQDRNGQPKRDITTIIHILNDLLCAQYKNYNPSTTSAPPASATTTTTSATPSAPSPNVSSAASAGDYNMAGNITKPTNSATSKGNHNNNDSFLSKSNSSSIYNATTKSSVENPSHLTTKNIESSMKFHPHVTLGNKDNAHFINERKTETIQDQLQVTKGKMEQLRRIMEERKARRRARREARAAPYSTSWSLKSSDTMDSEDHEDSGDNSGNNTVKMQVDTTSTSSSSTSNQSGKSTANGQANPATQTAAGSSPSDIFNPELEPVTA